MGWWELTDVQVAPVASIFFYTEDSNIRACTPKGNRLWFKCRQGVVSHLSMNRARLLWAACCFRPSTEAAIPQSIRRRSHSKLWAVTPLRPLGTDRTRGVTAGSLVCCNEAEERIDTDSVSDDEWSLPQFSYCIIPVPTSSASGSNTWGCTDATGSRPTDRRLSLLPQPVRPKPAVYLFVSLSIRLAIPLTKILEVLPLYCGHWKKSHGWWGWPSNRLTLCLQLPYPSTHLHQFKLAQSASR